MSWLHKRAEEICSEDTPKAAIEAVAREFAERALRDLAEPWNVINCGDEAWCKKRVAEAIAAADKEET